MKFFVAFFIIQSAAFGQEIKNILQKQTKNYALSVRTMDGKEILEFQGSKSLSPASIAKTISTGCSLNVLGPQYQFETWFLYRGSVQNDILNGDLVIRGYGEPALVIEDLREVVEKIRSLHGIRKINGKIIFDVSYFGEKFIPMSEGFSGDNGRSFSAELTPVSMNQNSFSVWILPDIRTDDKVRVATLPSGLVDLQLVNQVKVGKSNSVAVNYNPNALKATVTGTMARDSEPKAFYRAVTESYDYYTKLFAKLWTEQGGEWGQPQFEISTKEVKSQLLWKNSSRSLAKILMDINKHSLNLGAELTLLAAAGQKYGLPTSMDKSIRLLRDCMANSKINGEDIFLNNASGLSRESKLKASALSRFLVDMYNSPYAPEYLSTFSLAGIDGTTKARMSHLAGSVRAKTGSIKGVRSIAGYIKSKTKKDLAFVLIFNGVDPSDKDVKVAEDRIIDLIYNN